MANSCFDGSYRDVLDSLKFHACLSHLQPLLDNAVRGAEDAVIPRDNIVAFE